jgi:hypothetical protein
MLNGATLLKMSRGYPIPAAPQGIQYPLTNDPRLVVTFKNCQCPLEKCPETS